MVMGIMKKNETTNWWWFDTHNSSVSKRSPWLHSTLAELDEKTKAMLKLIEEDADSFKQRAEMYYKKRPELISMVEDFYKAHRLLAERYDQVKSENGTRLLRTCGSPFVSVKHKPEKSMSVTDETNDSYSLISDVEDFVESEVEDYAESEVEDPCAESEVDDPEEDDKHLEEENEIQGDHELKLGLGALSAEVCDDDEITKLREEIERLMAENMSQKDQLRQKDEEKREVIRQLSFAVGALKDENSRLRKYIVGDSPKKWSPLELAKDSPDCKKGSPLELSKFKGGFFGKLFK